MERCRFAVGLFCTALFLHTHHVTPAVITTDHREEPLDQYERDDFHAGSLHDDLVGFDRPEKRRRSCPVDAIASQRDDRKCGEIIEEIRSPDVISAIVNGFVSSFGTFLSNPDNIGGINYTDFYGPVRSATGHKDITFKATHGYKAVKVCGKCRWFPEVGKKYPAFRDFCGRGAFGRSATFSGLALIPIEPATGKVPEGALKGAVWSRSIQTDSFQVPSVQWRGLSNIASDPQYFIELMGGVMTAASGHVTLWADNFGYGESRDRYKGIFVKQLYQTSTIPLWLNTQKMIAGMTRCASELVDAAYVSGYSEGGYGAIAVAEGLSAIGVDVLKLQSGGPPIDLVQGSQTFISQMLQDRFSPQFAYVLPMIGGTYSSTVTGLPNFGKASQSILSDSERDRCLSFVLAGLAIPDARVLAASAFQITGQGQVSNVNRNILNERVINGTIEGDICHPDVGLDDLCESLQVNSLMSAIEKSKVPVEICHSPVDELVQFIGDTPLNNSIYIPTPQQFRNLITGPLTNIYIHAPTAAICVLIQAFTTIEHTSTVQPRRRCDTGKKVGDLDVTQW